MHHDDGLLGRGRMERRAAEGRAFAHTLMGVAVFTGVVLVNGILAIGMIELLETIGWWPATTPEP